MAEIVAVIPARFASTRLPGKPLLAVTGKPLIQHVVEAARRCALLDRIIVATDDMRIFEAVRKFGGEAAMTRDDHPSGTDRVAEVAASLAHAEIIVNLQGDEPEISPEALNSLVNAMRAAPNPPMATLASPIRDESDVPRSLLREGRAARADGRALYFSRSPIPMHRDGAPEGGIYGHLHMGVYAYRRDFLLSMARLPVSPLERAEKLEQLRVLDAGHAIAVGIVEEPSIGIDTPEDYRRFVARQSSQGV